MKKSNVVNILGAAERREPAPPLRELAGTVRLSDVVRVMTLSMTTQPDHAVAVECFKVLCRHFDSEPIQRGKVPNCVRKKANSIDYQQLLSWLGTRP